MDIGTWLQSLGLLRYEAVFRENEIDRDALPELEESDLEKIGIPLGPRKLLLKAIRALGTTAQPHLVNRWRSRRSDCRPDCPLSKLRTSESD